jgi:hypothetical protein
MQNRRGAGAGATIGSFFCFSPGTDLCRWSYLLGRQTGAAAVLTIKKGAFIVKTQKAAGGKNAVKLSDAVIEKRYLDLQNLRDAVRTAEMNCAAQTWKKPLYRKASGNLVSAPGRNGRTDFGGQR